MKRARGGLVSGILVGLTVPMSLTLAPTNATTLPASALNRDAAKPVLSSSTYEVTEGDRLTLTARIKAPRRATRATLQKWSTDVYSSSSSWAVVRTVKVRGRGKVRFKTVATDENTERYRVSVAYRSTAKPLKSRALRIQVWRWIPLNEYRPYYEAQAYAAGFGSTTIAGHAYSGWGAATYSHTGTWESRFTPGRHCKSFKAVLGVADISGDGSSGLITLTADDTQIYTSPTLTPGMSVPVTIDLAQPYRFGIQLFAPRPVAQLDATTSSHGRFSVNRRSYAPESDATDRRRTRYPRQACRRVWHRLRLLALGTPSGDRICRRNGASFASVKNL